MAESTDPKLMIDQAAPLVASAVEQSLSDSGSVVEDIDALIKDVESLEPAAVTATVATVQNLTEQARAIDQTARSAASTAAATPPPAPSSANAAALNQADQALANDLDALLQGDFESIDAVLDGVFDEQAVLVQADERAKAKTPKQLEIESAASRETDQVHQEQPTVRAAQPVAAIEPTSASMTASVELPRVEAVAPAPIPASSPPVVVAAAMAVPVGAPMATAPSPCASAAPVHVAPVHVESPAEIVVADVTVSIVAPPQTVIPSAKPRRKIQIRIDPRVIAGPLMQFVHQALTLVNLPMKFVPVKFKPAVDLVVMSLVLWVPLAFILPPKVAAWNAARAAAAHTTGAVHGESSNAGHESGHEAPAEDHGSGGGGHEAPKGHGGGH